MLRPASFLRVATAVWMAGCSSASDAPASGGAGGIQQQASGGVGGASMLSGGDTSLPPMGGSAGGAPMSGGSGGMTAGSGGMSGGSGGRGGMPGGSGGGGMPGEPDASVEAPCDRACLIALNTAYLEALSARDASSLPLAPDVRFTENGEELALNEGLWAVASALSDYRQDFAEVPAGQSALFATLEDDAGVVMLAARLRVVDHRITEIETIVARSGEVMFFSPDNLMADSIYDTELDVAARGTREQLVAIVDLYFQGLEDADGSSIPFDSNASRTENGVVTASGSSISNLGVFSYIGEITRRYVLVDEERGAVLPFALFEIPSSLSGARTLHIAELFKVSGGDIMKIDAIMVNRPLGTTSGWQ
jgi:hypothetical protein